MISLRENIPLAPFTTFRVGGPARFFVAVENIEELKEALAKAKQFSWPILVLAGGSNVIISSLGFAGLVIHVQIGSHAVSGNKIISGPAEMMSTLVDLALQHSLAGLEWAGGLPGTLGGAIRGNAGAFGGEIKDIVETVVSVNMTTQNITTRSNTDCQFRYRESIFKTDQSEVIVSATLQLKPGDEAALRQIANEHIQYRRDRHPLEHPNAGSIFKNTPVEKVPPTILEQFKDVIKNDPFPVVPTAKIIADAGLAGAQVGQAQVSTKHTNYIVNLGGATGEEVVQLISHVQRTVQDKFGIELEVEPVLVGF